MARKIEDPALLRQQYDASQGVELTDPNGRVLGMVTFSQELGKAPLGYKYPFTEEESLLGLKEAMEEGGGRTLKEILHDLEARAGMGK